MTKEPQAAARLAAVMFAVSGLLAGLNALAPTASSRGAVALIAASDLLVAGLAWFAPWSQWGQRSTLILIPPAFAIMSAALRFGSMPAYSYGVFFVVGFLWIGLTQPPLTGLWATPIAAAAYVVPALTTPHAPAGAIASVGITIPICVLSSEALARSLRTLARTRAALEDSAEALTRAALTDPLTGLGNRRHGEDLLASLKEGDALAVIDLDRFKIVNDRFGHAEGDRLLADLAGHLREAVRGNDTVARFGGDEFVLVIRGAHKEALPAVRRIMEGWRTIDPRASFCAGVAVHGEGRTPERTFFEADAALYEGKRLGGNRVVASESWWALLDVNP